MRWTSIAISLLIISSGLLGSRALTRVDQDLRVIHAEYTLAATDLGHVNGELIRYRTSVIRACGCETPPGDHDYRGSERGPCHARVGASREAVTGRRPDVEH